MCIRDSHQRDDEELDDRVDEIAVGERGCIGPRARGIFMSEKSIPPVTSEINGMMRSRLPVSESWLANRRCHSM